MSLPILREHADTVRLFDPATGDELDLSLCSDATLANLRDMIRDAEEEQRIAKHQIDGEVLARMDREGVYTIRVEGFEITAPSPAQRSEFDGAALHAALMAFVDTGELTVGAVDRAVEQVLTFKPKKAGIEALRKLGGEIADTIATHEAKTDPVRRVTVKRAA